MRGDGTSLRSALGKLTSELWPRAKGREVLAKRVTAQDPQRPALDQHFEFNYVIEPRGGVPPARPKSASST